MSQVVVSTECPTCSGPLDFSEGANAIRCPSCGSRLLVTGRKQVLSYWVAPKVRADVAGAAARTGRLEARVARAQLFFVPFYRLTAHDFQWQDAPPKPEPESPTLTSMLVGGADRGSDRAEVEIPLGAVLGWGADLLLGQRAGDVVRDILGAPPKPARSLEPALLTSTPRPAPAPDASVQFLDRYVEKSFPAVDLPDLGVYSLGVRTQALRVSLFRREALAALGTIVAAQMDQGAAIAQGLSARGFEHVVYRQVLGRILSVIYFPFWMVELAQGNERWVTVVDAVAETVVQPRAPLTLYEALGRAPEGETGTVGLRPLVCPNCGADLPVEPDDVIFFCASCNRAWQIHGAELTETPHEIAEMAPAAAPDAVGAGKSAGVVYLPFWQLDPAAAGPDGHAWVPAFRCRRLKALHDLAARLSAKPPAYRPWTGERPTVHGCFYDVEDAILLARFTAAGRRRTPTAVKAAASAEPAFTGARLTWLPFARESGSLLDPVTGLALPEALLG
jgi:DNA-directed RNA polymerase subunit RPC12/RpoP